MMAAIQTFSRVGTLDSWADKKDTWAPCNGYWADGRSEELGCGLRSRGAVERSSGRGLKKTRGAPSLTLGQLKVHMVGLQGHLSQLEGCLGVAEGQLQLKSPSAPTRGQQTG